MDVLSEILRVFRMRATLYFRAELAPPVGIAVPANPGVARFHIVLQGECSIRAEGDATAVRLREGDLVLVPHGRAHVITDGPDSPVEPLADVLAAVGYNGSGMLRTGGDAPTVRLVCGHFGFDAQVLHPLLARLPSVLLVRAPHDGGFVWLDDAVGFLEREVEAQLPGRDAVIERLSEILFVQMIRAYLAQGGDAVGLGWLVEPHLTRAITALHAEPDREWSLEAMAKRAGLSRTVFAERFHRLVGVTPMQYLGRWRIELAKQALHDGEIAIAALAERVGYRSEAAFCRAFKRWVGVGPGAFRARHEPGRSARPVDGHSVDGGSVEASTAGYSPVGESSTAGYSPVGTSSGSWADGSA